MIIRIVVAAAALAAVAAKADACVYDLQTTDTELVFKFSRPESRGGAAASLLNAFPAVVRSATNEGANRALVLLSDGVDAVRFASTICADPAFAPSVEWIVAKPEVRLHVVEKIPDVFPSLAYDDSLLAALAQVNVAVADTGVDARHCMFYDPSDFTEATLFGTPLSPVPPDAGHPIIRAYVRVCSTLGATAGTCLSETDFTDSASGHGTAMASIFVGKPCLVDRGVLGGKARLVFFDISLTSKGTLDLPVHLGDLLQSAYDLGVRTASFSWGGGCATMYQDLDAQIDEFLWTHPDFLLVISAGNCGDGTYGVALGVASPGSAKNVLSVAALWGTQAVASFSSIGGRDGRKIPLVASPGVYVVAANAAPGDATTPHNAEFSVSGTSPAAPFAAATLETLRQMLHTTSSATLRAAAIASASPLSSVVSYATGSVMYGESPETRAAFGGLRYVSVSRLVAFDDETLALGQVAEFCFSGAERVAVVWNDPPGSPFDSTPLVNSLLVWGYDPASVAATARLSFDGVNNHKSIDGSKIVRVFFSSGATGDQNFSLVAYGSNVTSCDAGDDQMPFPVPRNCTVAGGFGTGLIRGTACLPSSCDAGYVFSTTQNACVAGSAALAVCPPQKAYDFSSSACVCPQPFYACPDGITVVECATQMCAGSELAATLAPSAAWQDSYYAAGGADAPTPPAPLAADDETVSILSYSLIAVLLVMFAFFGACVLGQYKSEIDKGWAAAYRDANKGYTSLDPAGAAAAAETSRRVLWCQISTWYVACGVFSFLCLLFNGLHISGLDWLVWLFFFTAYACSLVVSLISIWFFIPAISNSPSTLSAEYIVGASILLTAFFVSQLALTATLVGAQLSCGTAPVCGAAATFMLLLMIYFGLFIGMILSQTGSYAFTDLYVRSFLVAVTIAAGISFVAYGIAIASWAYIVVGAVFACIGLFVSTATCCVPRTKDDDGAGAAEHEKGP